MTDEPKWKRSGRFWIPADWIDETAEMVSKTMAIIGGISPTQVKKPQQDGEQLERDDDKADK
jgi:hypothetical protein